MTQGPTLGGDMGSCEKREAGSFWYQDCAGIITILSGCLSQKDLLGHGAKAGLWPEGPPQEPARALLEVHQACHSDPGLRKAISKQINRRFPGLIQKVRAANPEDLAELDRATEWPVHLLWACLNDPRERVRAFGRLLAHDLLWTAVRETFVEARDNPDHRELERLREKSRTLALDNQRLERRLAKAGEDLKRARKSRGKAPRAAAPVPANVGQQREIRKLRYALEKAEAELARLGSAREEEGSPEARDDRPPVCEHGSEPCDHCLESGDCCRENEGCCREGGGCRDCPLEGRSVAVIGGLDRMEETYRQVVENLGGRFEFHCGRVKAGCQKVQGIVNRSDYVIFITSINSHAALKVTKTFCKRKCKKFIALKQRGVDSLERTLRQASQG